MAKSLIKISKETPIKVKKGTITIQKLEEDFFEWCVQYGGGGHYFHNFDSLACYCYERWKIKGMREDDFR